MINIQPIIHQHHHGVCYRIFLVEDGSHVVDTRNAFKECDDETLDGLMDHALTHIVHCKETKLCEDCRKLAEDAREKFYENEVGFGVPDEENPEMDFDDPTLTRGKFYRPVERKRE